jgi:large subunit ribosomal protein L33
VGLLAYADAGESEFPQMAAGPAVHAVPVAHPGRTGIARLAPELVHGGPAFGIRGGRAADDPLQLGATGGMPLDGGPAPLVLRDLALPGHQTATPPARIRATAASIPIRSTVLIALALSVSRTYRPSLGSQYLLRWMLGSKRREVRRCEWETVLPKPGLAPVSWQWADKELPAFHGEPLVGNGNHCHIVAVMARNELRPVVRLRSTAGTGFTYVTRKNRRNDPDRMVLRKYDPLARKHVDFREER